MQRPPAKATSIGNGTPATVVEPQIFVGVQAKKPRVYMSTHYAAAKLRNKGGYVYLQWRDGDKVKSFYVGKRAVSSPTGGSSEIDAAGAAAVDLPAKSVGQAKSPVLVVPPRRGMIKTF